MNVFGVSIFKPAKKSDRLEALTADLVAMADISVRLGISRVNAAALIRTGRLPGIKIANRWVVTRRDLELFADTYVKGPGRPRQKFPERAAAISRPRDSGYHLTSWLRQLGKKREPR